MDIVMGERTEGFSAIQEIRRTEELNSVPIFILSSNCVNLPDFETPGGNWLAHDLFLQKPVRLIQLLDKIRSTLARLDEGARVVAAAGIAAES
jgi:DNA-binding response OmpR family regulator